MEDYEWWLRPAASGNFQFLAGMVFELDSSPTPWGGEPVNMIFLYRSTCFNKLGPTLPLICGMEGYKRWYFCADLNNFFQLLEKCFRVDHPLWPSPCGVMAGKCDFSVQIWVFYLISGKKKFLDLIPPLHTPMIWRSSEHDIFSVGLHVAINSKQKNYFFLN